VPTENTSLNGDYIVQGFRNADLRDALFGPTDANGERRLSARITRTLVSALPPWFRSGGFDGKHRLFFMLKNCP